MAYGCGAAEIDAAFPEHCTLIGSDADVPVGIAIGPGVAPALQAFTAKLDFQGIAQAFWQCVERSPLHAQQELYFHQRGQQQYQQNDQAAAGAGTLPCQAGEGYGQRQQAYSPRKSSARR